MPCGAPAKDGRIVAESNRRKKGKGIACSFGKKKRYTAVLFASAILPMEDPSKGTPCSKKNPNPSDKEPSEDTCVVRKTPKLRIKTQTPAKQPTHPKHPESVRGPAVVKSIDLKQPEETVHLHRIKFFPRRGGKNERNHHPQKNQHRQLKTVPKGSIFCQPNVCWGGSEPEKKEISKAERVHSTRAGKLAAVLAKMER
ncbi:F-box protein 18-like protein [Anopheles sinensis]|uniref:F-box protein 18-like protein n=1 Tax=Anopheles sinensis TaxID=74873 RepID=A0A084VWR9_ANOSI|nr:F-box protein 18-like protein [Anopheles sinensis]